MDNFHQGFCRPLTPIEQGIKLVGIGKKKNQSLPQSLIVKIKDFLNNNYYVDRSNTKKIKINLEQALGGISVGAIMAALYFKYSTQFKKAKKNFSFVEGSFSNQDEINFLNQILIPNSNGLIEACLNFIGINYVPLIINNLAKKIIQSKTLNYQESFELGEFLFSTKNNNNSLVDKQAEESVKGFFLSYLRVRYESEEELKGLLDSLKKYYPVEKKTNNNSKIIFCEPLSGNKAIPFITPIIAESTKEFGLEPYHLVGKNPGPKFVFNLYDLLNAYQIKTSNLSEINIINLNHVSTVLDDWVLRRWRIMKRPFLSTIEKFLNPVGAEYLVSSVFHAPYLEKMLLLGEHAGYRAMLFSKLGMEGGLSPSLKRDLKLTGSKQVGKKYIRKDFSFSLEDIGEKKIMDEKFELEKLGTKWNLELINKYYKTGDTGIPSINLRIKLAKFAYSEGIKWMLLTS